MGVPHVPFDRELYEKNGWPIPTDEDIAEVAREAAGALTECFHQCDIRRFLGLSRYQGSRIFRRAGIPKTSKNRQQMLTREQVKAALRFFYQEQGEKLKRALEREAESQRGTKDAARRRSRTFQEGGQLPQESGRYGRTPTF